MPYRLVINTLFQKELRLLVADQNVNVRCYIDVNKERVLAWLEVLKQDRIRRGHL